MAIKKNGIFFTLISLLFVTLIVISFTTQDFVTLKNKVPVTEATVRIANEHVQYLESGYIPQSISESAYLALEALAVRINITQVPFADEDAFSQAFEEVMLYGTYQGQDIDVLNQRRIMTNNTLIYDLARLENLSASFLNLPTTFNYSTPLRAAVFQDNSTGPYSAAVNISLGFKVNASSVVITRSTRFTALLTFDNLTDPNYLLSTNGRVSRTFKAANQTNWNLATTQDFIAKKKYRYLPQSPTFLGRFYTGGLADNSSCCGVESLIDADVIAEVGHTNESYADCAFFGGGCYTSGILYRVTGISNEPSYPFRLDSSRVLETAYNLSDYAIPDPS